MKTATAIREGWLNAASGTARTLVLALLATLLVGGLSTAELSTVRGIDEEARAFQRSGGSILVLDAPGHIDPRRCAELQHQPGVRGAGALREGEPVRLAAAPDQSLPVREVTDGVLTILVGEHQLGVGLSEHTAATLGVRPGDHVVTTSTARRLGAVYPYPDDGRTRGLDYALLVPVPAQGAFDACWVDQWPSSPHLSALLRATLIPGATDLDGIQVRQGQLNPTLGATFDAPARMHGRLTRWAPVVGFLLGSLLAMGALWLRRLERAAAAHAGLGRRAACIIAVTETLAWLIPMTCVCLALSVAYAATGAREDVVTMIVLGLVTPLAASVGALSAAVLSSCRMSEDRLFDYFKQR